MTRRPFGFRPVLALALLASIASTGCGSSASRFENLPVAADIPIEPIPSYPVTVEGEITAASPYDVIDLSYGPTVHRRARIPTVDQRRHVAAYRFRMEEHDCAVVTVESDDFSPYVLAHRAGYGGVGHGVRSPGEAASVTVRPIEIPQGHPWDVVVYVAPYLGATPPLRFTLTLTPEPRCTMEPRPALVE